MDEWVAEFDLSTHGLPTRLSDDRGPEESLGDERRQGRLFDDYRNHLFDITNQPSTVTPEQIVFSANHRCDQENLLCSSTPAGDAACTGQRPRRQRGLHVNYQSCLQSQSLAVLWLPVEKGRWRTASGAINSRC